jgi:hypothetical protein
MLIITVALICYTSPLTFWGEMIAPYTTVGLMPTLPLRGMRSVLPRRGRSSSKPPVGPYLSKWITNGIAVTRRWSLKVTCLPENIKLDTAQAEQRGR